MGSSQNNPPYHLPFPLDFASLHTSPTQKYKSPEEFHWLTHGTLDEEHLLRSSSKSIDSFPRRSHRARSSSIVTNPYEDPPQDDFYFRNKVRNRSGRQSKYSPTPSIKRGKAEKLLKEHGSPPGIRVTAGGRIVPDGLTPLTSPRFDLTGGLGWPKFNNTSSRLKGYPFKSHAQVSLNDIEGFIVNVDGTGNPAQVVGGEIRPVEQHNGVYHLYVPPNNMQGIPQFGQLNGQSAFSPFQPLPIVGLTQNQGFNSVGISMVPHNHETPTLKQIKALEQYHTKIESDLKELDRNEVLQRDQLTSAARSEIVQMRIKLTTCLDQSRRAIQEAKRAVEEKQQQPESAQYTSGSNTEPVHPVLPSFIPYFAGQAAGAFHPQQLEAKTYARADQCAVPLIRTSEITSEHFQSPQAASNPYYHLGSVPIALQERAGNAGLGVANGSYNNGSSLENLKYHEGNENCGSRSINLDGSAHQPRRSHAIAIKDPKDQIAKTSSSLNPASPSYEPYKPQNIICPPTTAQSDAGQFVPSPKLVAEMDELVQSPGKHESYCEVSTVELSQLHTSDSSASTEDFFPHNTHQHSGTKYSFSERDSKVNLPAWMPKEGDTTTPPEGQSSRPSRPPNKFIWHDSPNDKFYLSSLDDSASHLPAHPIGGYHASEKANSASTNEDYRCLDIAPQSACCPESPNLETKRSPHHRESTVTDDADRSIQDVKDPVSHLLTKASERAASLSETTQMRGQAYFEGYKVGLRQELLDPNPDKEYRLGYRDGLLQSYLVTPASVKDENQFSGESGQESSTPQRRNYEHNLSTLKAPSCPSLFHPTKIPVNSLNNTPKNNENLYLKTSPNTPQQLESPKTAADFMSKPNVTLSNSCISNIEKLKRNPEPVSPSPNRYSRKHVNDGHSQVSFSFASHMSPCSNYDRQRYQKSGTSTAQTGSHAQGWIPSQLDGSSDGENDEIIDTAPQSPELHATPSTPSKTNKVDEKMMTKSPVKAKASAAMVKMGQLAGGLSSGSKREKKASSPKDISSPEKDKWRSKWRVRFEKLRESEQREIAEIRPRPVLNPSKAEQTPKIKIPQTLAPKP